MMENVYVLTATRAGETAFPKIEKYLKNGAESPKEQT